MAREEGGEPGGRQAASCARAARDNGNEIAAVEETAFSLHCSFSRKFEGAANKHMREPFRLILDPRPAYFCEPRHVRRLHFHGPAFGVQVRIDVGAERQALSISSRWTENR